MSRDWRLYWDDMVASCEKILRYAEGMDYDGFRQDEKTYDAVVRNLEIVGEAAKNLPAEAKDKVPHLEWRKIAGLRDVIAHAYFGIDDAIVWDVVDQKVPALLAALRKVRTNDSS